MGREAFRGEALSGTGTGKHRRTQPRHSQEGFALTPKKRPGPLYTAINSGDTIQSSWVREGEGFAGPMARIALACSPTTSNNGKKFAFICVHLRFHFLNELLLDCSLDPV